MRNAIGKAVLVLTLCANSVAQSPRQMTREKQMQFATNECFPKAGLGIITTSLYIELRSDRDQLLLDAGKKWIGLKAGVPEVVIVLMNQLSEDEPVHRLLFLDELINVFNACAIQGSNLPSMLCTLWDKDKTGGSVKKGRQIVYGKLSIVGGLAINDISDFSRVFGSHSVKGLYDRFIFGYSTSHVRYRPLRVVAEKFDTKPVHFPQWVWDAKDEWIGDDLSRGRLSQHALRIALITSACNGDTEITKSCLEAALRFCEWQQRLRQVFKPGLAETKDAEAFEAAWTALKEQFKKQKKSGEVHAKAELLTLEMDQTERWKLIHFTDVMNSKSYYRTYSSMIGRVRKTLVEEGFVCEVREVEEDGKGGVKKSKTKTPFVILLKEVK